MNPSSEDIKDILEYESSLGLVFGTNLFIGREPVTPIDCVTIYDTYGSAPDISLNYENNYNPSVQIRVRNVDYLTGWALIENISTMLHGRAHETWNSTYYNVILCSSGPALLDWDKNNRPRFIINFNIKRREQ